MKVYVLVCTGKGKNEFNGKPVSGTFGVYLTMDQAMSERNKMVNVTNHFAYDAEWIVSIDQLEDN
jgi:hypothetical protein